MFNLSRLKMALDRGDFVADRDEIKKVSMNTIEAGLRTMKSLQALRDELDDSILKGKKLIEDYRKACGEL